MSQLTMLTCFILLIFGDMAAQGTENSNLILGYEEVKELGFYEYEPKLRIKATISTMDLVENEYPEQLMESVISATNQDWVNYNTLGGESDKQDQSHFDRIKSMDKEKNYFELHHKLTFDIGETPTAIIKFFFYQENQKPVSAAYVMQNVEGRWQRTSHAYLSTLSIIVMRLKSEVLRGIALRNSDDPTIKSLMGRVSTEGGLDLAKLEEEFISWYDPEIDQLKINLFKDPETW